MSDLEKTISKKITEHFFKKIRKSCRNTACEQKTNSDKLKFGSNKKKQGLEWTMNGLGKPRKNLIKNLKKSKNQSEIAACEQKNH